ncbi:MAG TPA: hypothetical protein VNP04_17560 [Alphaproteobacteria bacterium]|nr:hypothetical protein [Alphaproteobacteria bacterium]
MDDLQGIDVERIVQQIQEKVRERQANTLPTAIAHPTNGHFTADLTALHNHGDPFRITFTSHRKILGRLIILAKEGLRRLLTPVLEQQLAYNTTNAQMIHQLWEQLQEVHRLQMTMQGEIKDLKAEIRDLSAEVGALGAQQVALRGEVDTVGQRQDAALRALREATVQQLEALEQQHAHICAALRQGVMEQLEGMSQQVQDRMAQLQERLLCPECHRTTEMDDAGKRPSTP